MNHKFLLIFSILITGVGIIGLTLDKEDNVKPIANNTEIVTEQKINITLAQAIENLSTGSILNHKKYILNSIFVSISSPLIQYDLSDIESINGYLIKNTILKNSYITKDMIEAPDTQNFILLSLQPGEVIYKFNIDKKNEYLIDSLNNGDFISLQLRVLEFNENKGTRPGIILESDSLSGNKKQNYSIIKIIPNMLISNIRKYSDEELPKINNNRNTEDIVGFIDVRIKTSDIETIHAIEKTGDILLTPNDGSEEEKNLNDIIPKLKTVRELRG